MADYQEMYYALFNDVTDAITKLQQAQQRTEEMFMESKKTVLTPLRQNVGDKNLNVLPEKKPTTAKKKPPSHNDER